MIVRGDPVITRSGLEAGPIYAHSRRVRELLAEGDVDMSVDLFPDLDLARVRATLVDTRSRGQSLAKWLRRSGITPVGASLMREATGNKLPTEPNGLAHLAKAVPIAVDSMAGIDRAISSAGGVAWSEVDDDFQLSALPGVYAVGEMLNWEAPTGGYLLQALSLIHI